MTHYCIEVPHQDSIRYFHCNSFWDKALESGLDYVELSLDDDISTSIRTCLQTGKKALRLYRYGEPVGDFEEDSIDKEYIGRKHLGWDLNALLVMDSISDAEYYANKYQGHQWVKVRLLARNILDILQEKEGQ